MISPKQLEEAFAAEFPPKKPPESAEGSAGNMSRAEMEEIMDAKLQDLKEQMNRVGMPTKKEKENEENGTEEHTEEE